MTQWAFSEDRIFIFSCHDVYLLASLAYKTPIYTFQTNDPPKTLTASLARSLFFFVSISITVLYTASSFRMFWCTKLNKTIPVVYNTFHFQYACFDHCLHPCFTINILHAYLFVYVVEFFLTCASPKVACTTN